MKSSLSILAAALFLVSCQPKPIDIAVPQKAGALSVSSTCVDAHTVYVSASYSASSLVRVLDTTKLKEAPGIPRELLIDSAVVTIGLADSTPDTLRELSPGLYGRRDLQLQPGGQYTLLVHDYDKNITARATTVYIPALTVDSIAPKREPRSTDTLVKLQVALRNAAAAGYYFVSYNTVRNAREHAIPLPMNGQALNLFAPKQIALFTGEGTANGTLSREVTLQVSPTDTVFVQVGQIDRAYYDYLTAYKRSGALINQISGEPINLPSNILTGHGFFCLYEPVRKMFDLNRY